MLNETFQPGQLAAAAARVSANGINSVTYFVRMSRGRGPRWSPPNVLRFPQRLDLPESLLLNPDREPADPDDLLDLLVAREELLFFSCGDVEFLVSTRGTRDPEVVPGEAVTATEVSDGSADFDVFEGRTVLNPGFLYEFARPVEVLIDFGPDQYEPTVESTSAATLIFARLAEIASVAGKAPILFMNSPVAPFTEASPGDLSSPKQEALRRARGMTMRMSIGVLAVDTKARLKVYERVAAMCGEWGLGLHIGDRRPDRVRGEWVFVRKFDQAVLAKKLEEKLSASVPLAPTTHGLPVTVMGPARIGSSHAILSALKSHGIGIAGLSVSALQEVAFVNLILSSPAQVDLGPTRVFPVTEGLQQVISSLTGRSVTANELGALAAASDYKLLAGRPHEIRSDEGLSDIRRPLWLSWDLPFASSVVLEVLQLAEAMVKRRGISFEIEYARSRVIGTGRIRGRAKFALVPPVGVDVRDFLTREAEAVEGKMRIELAKSIRVPEDDVHIRVRWRERRLGAWDFPL